MKIKILSLAFAGILLAGLCIVPISNAKTTVVKNKIPCPIITLSSPPAILRVHTGIVQCTNVLTVSTNNCSPYTFHFTWTGGSQNSATASGSNVLTFSLPTITTTIHLTITDSGGGSSINYDFTPGACKN